MNRKATAVWQGSIKEGKGHISTPNKILDKTQYSFSSRFEEGTGTNPEELIAAAHSGCFAMKLSLNLTEAGFPPQELHVTAEISMKDLSLTKSHLILKAKVEGISQDKFDECVKDAEENCPISKVLNLDISVDSTLNG
jgi:osmotically inducible protein OsmC